MTMREKAKRSQREESDLKDLKHLIFFEDLLQNADNALIRQAQSEGRVCVAYVCENTPEPLLNLPGAFSARLRAPRTGSMEMATYYMTSFLCEYSRALLERAIEGGYNFADAIITEASLSFLGVGVPAPQPSWGNILAEGREVITKAWWMVVYPGLATALAVMGTNIFGDGLRDILDPHTN